MPTDIQEAVRRLTVQATSTGVDDTTAKLNKLADAQEGVAVASDKSSKASLSYEQAYARQSFRLDETARMQAKFSQESKIAQGALAQGVITAGDYAARMDLINAKYGQASTLSRAFSQATSGVSAQITALAAGAGPVGVFLSALGPWGIAAAAGIGLVGTALHYVAEESTRMGEKAIELQRFKEVTELTVGQIGALRSAGSEFGLTGDVIAMAFQRMTSQLDDARRATGPLYDDVRRVNGGLADELRQTSSTADAINVLARAYSQAGDAAAKAAIARAAFGGRGGAALGPVLGQIADAGGIQALTVSMGRFNEASDEQTRRWARMQAQIDETNKRARNLLASIFTGEGLAAQLAAAKAMERIATAAKDVAAQREGLSFLEKLFINVAEAEARMAGGGLTSEQNQGIALEAARRRISQGQGINLASPGASAEAKAWGDLVDIFHQVPSAADAAAKSLKQLQDEAASDAKLQRERIGLLGQAATYDEQRRAKLGELKSALLDNRLTQQDYNRAVAAENSSVNLQILQARIGLLGELATVGEQVRAIQERVNLERAKGVKISNDEAAAIARVVQLRAESAKLQQQAQYGIFDPTRQGANAQLELRTLIDNGTVKTAEDYAAAQTVIAKKLRETADAAAVARSNLPQLTQLMLDAGNLSKQLDTFATSSLNNLTTALADIATGTKSTGDAFRALGQQVVRALDEMLIKMLIIQPIAAALGFAGGGGGGILSFLNIGAPGFPAGKAHTGGIVGHDSFASTYVHPAYFDNAPKFAMGGIAGLGPDEVPIVAHRDEEIVRPDDPRHRWNGGASDTTVKQEITFKIDGAVGRSEIVAMINHGMSVATQQAVAISSAGAPARQVRLQKLGS